MKYLLAFVLSLALAACAFTSTRSAQESYYQTCATYDSLLVIAIQMRKDGQLNQAQKDAITLADSQVAPICYAGKLPADPEAATQQVSQAITTLAIYGIIKKESK